MEALRVRAQASGDVIGDVFTIDDFEVGYAVPAVETGTLSRPAALLMQAGFTSRLAAIKAVTDTAAAFTTGRELAAWLKSDRVVALTEEGDWPTPETAFLWKSFLSEYEPPERTVWSIKSAVRAARWQEGLKPPPTGMPLRIRHIDGHAPQLLSPAHDFVGHLKLSIGQEPKGVLFAHVGTKTETVVLTYYGPDDIDLS